MAGLLDLILPPACAGCRRAGALLCRECVSAIAPVSRPEDRFVAADPAIVVGDALTLGMAAFAHAGPMRRALAALKYSGASRLAPILAREAASSLAPLRAIAGPAVLVPVPVHPERLRVRGYNQAELIASALSRACAIESATLLDRVRQTEKQHRLDRAARLANLRGAFAAIPVDFSRPPPTVILVDDIVTTTATLEACASVLREAGILDVYGFALAREV